MNRPAPISVFSDQYRTKSTTRSRTSCGTHTLVRAPQDFFLKRCARPSIRPAPRPWFGSSFPETRSVVVPLDGPAGSCPGRQLRHSRRTLSANGRTPWAAVHAPHRDQKPALYPTSAASGWQPSPLKCSAFALFACRPLRYLNGRTLSPLPAEARHFSHYLGRATSDWVLTFGGTNPFSLSIRLPVPAPPNVRDRKSTRLNSSHMS